MSLFRWMFPSPGDFVAAAVWLGLGRGLVVLYLRQRRAERAAARHPIGDRFQRPGWSP